MDNVIDARQLFAMSRLAADIMRRPCTTDAEGYQAERDLEAAMAELTVPAKDL